MHTTEQTYDVLRPQNNSINVWKFVIIKQKLCHVMLYVILTPKKRKRVTSTQNMDHGQHILCTYPNQKQKWSNSTIKRFQPTKFGTCNSCAETQWHQISNNNLPKKINWAAKHAANYVWTQYNVYRVWAKAGAQQK